MAEETYPGWYGIYLHLYDVIALAFSIWIWTFGLKSMTPEIGVKKWMPALHHRAKAKSGWGSQRLGTILVVGHRR